MGELPASASRAELLKALLDERKRAESTPLTLKPLNVRIPKQLHRQVKTDTQPRRAQRYILKEH